MLLIELLPLLLLLLLFSVRLLLTLVKQLNLLLVVLRLLVVLWLLVMLRCRLASCGSFLHPLFLHLVVDELCWRVPMSSLCAMVNVVISTSLTVQSFFPAFRHVPTYSHASSAQPHGQGLAHSSATLLLELLLLLLLYQFLLCLLL